MKELSTNENQAQKDEDIMIDCDDDPKMIISDNDDEIIEDHSNDDRDLDHEIKNSNKHQNHRRRSMPRLRSLRNNKNKTNIPQSKTTCDFQKSCENELPDTNRFVGSLLSVSHLINIQNPPSLNKNGVNDFNILGSSSIWICRI